MPKLDSASVEILAEDKTKQGITSAATRIGKLTKIVKDYWAEIMAGYIAVNKIIKAFDQFIKASNEQEKAISLLNTTLKATGRYTPEISKGMQDWAEAMQKVTVYGDDTIESAQAILATYDNIATDTFPKVIKTAMNLSTLMGTDLPETARSLAMALTDPENGLMRLRRAGIIFTDSQKDTIKQMVKMGDTAKAQALILDIIKGKIGDTAEAYGKTLAGQMGIAQNQFNELKETIGDLTKTILPFWIEQLIKGTDALKNFLDAIGGVNDKVDEMKKRMEGMNKEQLTKHIEYLKEIVKQHEENAKALHEESKNMEITRRSRKDAAENLKFEIEQLVIARDELNKYTHALKNYEETHKETEKVKRMISIVSKQEFDAEEMVAEGYMNTSEANKIYLDGIDPVIMSVDEITNAFQEQATTIGYTADKMGGFWTGTQKYFAKTKKQYEGLKDTLLVLSEVSDVINSAISTGYSNREVELDDWYKKQREIIDATITDETAKEEAIKALDEKADARRRKIAHDEAVAKKTFAIFSILIDTARGIAEAFPKVWKMVMIGAMGAAQLAIVAAQKIPAMQMGGFAKKQQGGMQFGDRVPAMLEPGEAVIPRRTVQRNAAAIGFMQTGGAIPVTIPIYLDGKIIAKNTVDRVNRGQHTIDTRSVVKK